MRAGTGGTPTSAAIVALTAGLASMPAQAQTVKDTRLAGLLDAGRFVEAESAAYARIATRPDDPDGYTTLTVAALNLDDIARRDKAVQALEACAVRLPEAAICHYGVGTVLGANALSQGAMKALGSAGRIRQSLARALELDPTFYAARNSLVQFYLAVPALAGGSVSKARELAEAARAAQPEHAKVLFAMISVEQKNYAEAEQGLASVAAGNDRELLSDVADLRSRIGFAYLADQRPPGRGARGVRARRRRPPAERDGPIRPGSGADRSGAFGRRDRRPRAFGGAGGIGAIADRLPSGDRLRRQRRSSQGTRAVRKIHRRGQRLTEECRRCQEAAGRDGLRPGRSCPLASSTPTASHHRPLVAPAPMRQIFLDTETTGLSPDSGDRIIEIGCVELVNRRHSGRTLHFYVNPERRSHEDALKVHGLTDDFLADKPLFAHVADELLAFVDGAEIIIHNASFDVGFLNEELRRLGRPKKFVEHVVMVTDSLLMAREIFPGKANSLDALCKRLEVDNTSRTLHGALLDARLLAEVYLRMTRGQNSLMIEAAETSAVQAALDAVDMPALTLPVIFADEAEALAHEALLTEIDKVSSGRTAFRRWEAVA